MNRIFIAAEFNPFHNGHAYIVNKAKEIFDSAPVVAAMSGSFVQRGGPAVTDKKIRAAVAAYCGVDLTVQLPFVYAGQNAETFALGSVRLAELCGCNIMCFGAENDDTEMFLKAADVIDSDEMKTMLKKQIKTNTAYPVARIEALNEITKEDFSFLKSANNILALEYVRAIKKLGVIIKPQAIKRERSVNNSGAPVVSATKIREELLKFTKETGSRMKDGEISVPDYAYKQVTENEDGIFSLKFNDIENYKYIFKANLITKEAAEIAKAADIGSGNENRLIKNAAALTESVGTFVDKCTSKRLTAARIRRSLVNIALKFNQSDMDEFKNNPVNYIRILSLGNLGAEIINDIKASENTTVITKLATDKSNLDEHDRRIIEYDIRADDLYNIFEDNIGSDFTYTPFILKK